MKFRVVLREQETDKVLWEEPEIELDTSEPADMNIVRLLLKTLHSNWYLVLIPVGALMFFLWR